jgi:hypothetical protein
MSKDLVIIMLIIFLLLILLTKEKFTGFRNYGGMTEFYMFNNNQYLFPWNHMNKRKRRRKHHHARGPLFPIVPDNFIPAE